MIGHQRPSVTGRLGFGNDGAQPSYKIVAIRIVAKYIFSLDSPNNNMLHCTGSIYSGFSRHSIFLSSISNKIKHKIIGVPIDLWNHDMSFSAMSWQKNALMTDIV
jgi:hypothetical protein